MLIIYQANKLDLYNNNNELKLNTKYFSGTSNIVILTVVNDPSPLLGSSLNLKTMTLQIKYNQNISYGMVWSSDWVKPL